VNHLSQTCITHNYLVSQTTPPIIFLSIITCPPSHELDEPPHLFPFLPRSRPQCPPYPAFPKTPALAPNVAPPDKTPRSLPCQWTIRTRLSKSPECSPIERTDDDSQLDIASRPKSTPWPEATPPLLEVDESPLWFILNRKCLTKGSNTIRYLVFLKDISRSNPPYKGHGTGAISTPGKRGGITLTTSHTSCPKS